MTLFRPLDLEVSAGEWKMAVWELSRALYHRASHFGRDSASLSAGTFGKWSMLAAGNVLV